MIKTFYKNKVILVTGGAGFIGSHLCDMLSNLKTKKIIVVDNLFLGTEENLKNLPDIIFYKSDASKFQSLLNIISEEKPDIVFNLATKALMYSFEDPFDSCKVNVDIALNLSEILRRGLYKKLIHISTSEVYGSAKKLPMSEEHFLDPETTYASGKASADLLLKTYYNQYDLDIVIARPFNNYGPRQNNKKYAAVVPITISRIFNNQAPIVSGSGLQTRDFIYVKDTAKFLIELGKNGLKGEIYNLGSGKEQSILDLVKQICKIMNFSKKTKFTSPRTADVIRHCSSIKKIKKVLPNYKLTSLSTGLKETIEFYKTCLRN